jgi:hypothetical protein
MHHPWASAISWRSHIVTKALLVVLAVMSVISWYLIVYKGISQIVRQKRSKAFLDFFWSATSLEAVQNELNVQGVHEPFGHLTAHSLRAQAQTTIRHRTPHRPHEGTGSSRPLLPQRPCRRCRQRHPDRRRPQLPTHPRLAEETVVFNLPRSVDRPNRSTNPQSGFLTANASASARLANSHSATSRDPQLEHLNGQSRRKLREYWADRMDYL